MVASMSPDPGVPSEELIRRVQQQAEALGKSVAEIEAIFAARVKSERHDETVRHSKESTYDLDLYLQQVIGANELAERSAVLVQHTSDRYDLIKETWQLNTNTLNQMVQDFINLGKRGADHAQEDDTSV